MNGFSNSGHDFTPKMGLMIMKVDELEVKAGFVLIYSRKIRKMTLNRASGFTAWLFP